MIPISFVRLSRSSLLFMQTCENKSSEKKEDCTSEKDNCFICLESPIMVTFEPCGHCLTCEECSRRVKKCFMCEKVVQSKVTQGMIGDFFLGSLHNRFPDLTLKNLSFCRIIMHLQIVTPKFPSHLTFFLFFYLDSIAFSRFEGIKFHSIRGGGTWNLILRFTRDSNQI